MKSYYINILRKREPKILDNINNAPKAYSDSFHFIADYVISPVIYMYTSWIINQVEKTPVKKIYFFSRDGYLMYLLATKICEARNNHIECFYFYCSRFSLRMAAYWMNDECAYDKLFISSVEVSASTFLKRAGFSEDDRKKVYEDIGFFGNEDELLNETEFSSLCEKVRNSGVFNSCLFKKSSDAYKTFSKYINQLEFSADDEVAIIDLGWTGSMQNTLRNLLDSMGIRTTLHGYYVGLFQAPHQCKNSYYTYWLFGPKNKITISWFSHNLLECLCSAPHGMTIGYDCSETGVVAKFADDVNEYDGIQIIQQSLEHFHSVYSLEYNKSYRNTALKLLFNLMVRPSTEEVSALNSYWFCDDIAEQYHQKIVSIVNKSQLKREILPFRLFRKRLNGSLYWFFGSVVASGYKTGFIYKLGFIITKWIIAVLK